MKGAVLCKTIWSAFLIASIACKSQASASLAVVWAWQSPKRWYRRTAAASGRFLPALARARHFISLYRWSRAVRPGQRRQFVPPAARWLPLSRLFARIARVTSKPFFWLITTLVWCAMCAPIWRRSAIGCLPPPMALKRLVHRARGA